MEHVRRVLDSIRTLALLPQLALLYGAWAVLAVRDRLLGSPERVGCVVGMVEVAHFLRMLADILPGAHSVCLRQRGVYSDGHDVGPFPFWLRPVVGPLLLARLARRSDVFIYIWETGLLLDRAWDFRFLRARGKKIVVALVGDDVRSPRKAAAHYRALGEESFVFYRPDGGPRNEARVRKNARDAERWADVIFTGMCPATSHLTREWPFPRYAVDLSRYRDEYPDFGPDAGPLVLHAPSDPVVKGTQVVRAAVRALREEGLVFRYEECIGVRHEEVVQALGRSNIAVNQLYSDFPGMFGMEALASRCAVLMSADPARTQHLPDEDAWPVAPAWRLEARLRELITDPAAARGYADRGREYVERHFSLEAARRHWLDAMRRHGVDLGPEGPDAP